MPTRLKRYYGQGQLHFVTFSCYRRLPLLGTARARNMFVKELSRVRRESSLTNIFLARAVPSRGSAGKEYVRQGALQSSARVWIPACGLCGHAQPCAYSRRTLESS